MYSYNRRRSLERELYIYEYLQSRKKSGTGAMSVKQLHSRQQSGMEAICL